MIDRGPAAGETRPVGFVALARWVFANDPSPAGLLLSPRPGVAIPLRLRDGEVVEAMPRRFAELDGQAQRRCRQLEARVRKVADAADYTERGWAELFGCCAELTAILLTIPLGLAILCGISATVSVTLAFMLGQFERALGVAAVPVVDLVRQPVNPKAWLGPGHTDKGGE